MYFGIFTNTHVLIAVRVTPGYLISTMTEIKKPR